MSRHESYRSFFNAINVVPLQFLFSGLFYHQCFSVLIYLDHGIKTVQGNCSRVWYLVYADAANLLCKRISIIWRNTDVLQLGKNVGLYIIM
jgi:hypothetical protein